MEESNKDNIQMPDEVRDMLMDYLLNMFMNQRRMQDDPYRAPPPTNSLGTPMFEAAEGGLAPGGIGGVKGFRFGDSVVAQFQGRNVSPSSFRGTTARDPAPAREDTQMNNSRAALDRIVTESKGNERYRNTPNVYSVREVVANNALNVPAAALDFIKRAGLREDGTLNEAGKARLAIYNSGVSRKGDAILDNRTGYQRTIDNFRKSSDLNNKAYVERFPITAGLEGLLRKGAEGLAGIPGKIAKQYKDGIENILEKLDGVSGQNAKIIKQSNNTIDEDLNNAKKIVETRDKKPSFTGKTPTDPEPVVDTSFDDVLNADLLGVDENMETTNLVKPDIPQPPDNLVRPDTPQGATDDTDDTQGLTPIRLDTFPGSDEDEGLFDLSGSDEPGQVSAFDLDPNKSYFDLESGRVIDPDDIQRDRRFAAREQFLRPFSSQIRMPLDDFQTMINDQYKAQKEGFPDIDVTQERRDLVNNPIEGQATAGGQGLVYADGSPIMEQGPTPVFDSEILDDETIRKSHRGQSKRWRNIW